MVQIITNNVHYKGVAREKLGEGTESPGVLNQGAVLHLVKWVWGRSPSKIVFLILIVGFYIIFFSCFHLFFFVSFGFFSAENEMRNLSKIKKFTEQLEELIFKLLSLLLFKHYRAKCGDIQKDNYKINRLNNYKI